jgi:catechol 2,3-dioxygenase-like lactoylglutathione lyase family enzyme
VRVRFARPTDRLDECLAFYRDLVGLPVLAEFRGHAGYDGAVFGLPDSRSQLELTQRAEAAARPASPEDQLVFYLPGPEAVDRATSRLRAGGHLPVATENPYWNERGAVAFADPDGSIVIFAPWLE